MLRVATIAVATLGIIMAMVSVASGAGPPTADRQVTANHQADPKPDKQPQPIYVIAPMDGIFWRGIFPGAKPYAEVGETVEVNRIVAHIEHMRSTKLTVGIRGTIVEFLVSDGQFVRAWQPLVKILPQPVKEKQDSIK
jgi:acetyl-CoA carboxylase biotin carboxyl carrier protein